MARKKIALIGGGQIGGTLAHLAALKQAAKATRIEGVIVGEAKKPVELPRLRFSVRDAQGAEIYAWNAVLEQPVLRPGEKAWFKSRLASPPPEGRNIDVRFFSKRDLAGGNI